MENGNLHVKLNDTEWNQPFENAAAMVERQAREHPDRIAAAGSLRSLTYSELNTYANRIAGALIREGIGKEDLIMVLLTRDIMYYAVNIGILKAGAAFVPVSPGYPDERIKYICDNADCRLIITSRDLADSRKELFDDIGIDVRCMEDLAVNEDTDDPHVRVSPEDLAYCIYTSGSTGRPKGVMIEHGNLSNFLQLNPKNHEVNAIAENGSVLLATVALTFDFSLMEEFIGLCNGMTVVMASEPEITNPLMLKSLMDRYGVDAMCCTPSYLRMIFAAKLLHDTLKKMKIYDMGGEEFTKELYEDIRRISPKAVIINGYGPTEATISCISKEMNEGFSGTIGTPSANVYCYIIGKDGNLLPPGQIGELLICGKGVARGYRNRDDLTAEVFTEYNGMRAYHTGDLARLTEDGEIEFHGRIDRQIKLKGLRIEPGEIENVMSQCPIIAMCAVMPTDDRHLILYYTLCEGRNDPEHTEETVRSYAKEHLADYMVPDYYMQLASMPVTDGFKLDRNKLPKPKSNVTKGKSPETELQKFILDSILYVHPDENLGTDTDLTVAGISSLDWMYVITAIGEKYNVSLTISELADCKTILELEKMIKELPSVTPAPDVREAKATFTQNLYYYGQKYIRTGETELLSMIRINRDIDNADIISAVRKAAAHHPGLFARFEERDDGLYLIASDSVAEEAASISVEVHSSTEHDIEIMRSRITQKRLPADLRRTYRFAIFETETAKYLFSQFIHCIGDGSSVSVLLDDVLRAIDGRKIKEESLNIFQAGREFDRTARTAKEDPMLYYEALLKKAVYPDLYSSYIDPYERITFSEETLSLSGKDCDILCKKLNISRTILFAGLTGLALGKRAGGGKVPLTILYNGRLDYRMTNTFGLLLRMILICPDNAPDISAAAYFNMTKQQYFKGITSSTLPIEELQNRFPAWADHIFIYQPEDTSHTLFGNKVEEIWLPDSENDETQPGELPDAVGTYLERLVSKVLYYEVWERGDRLIYTVIDKMDADAKQLLMKDVDRMCCALFKDPTIRIGELL